MESLSLTRDQALSLWSGSTDTKTLDYQRTNPREYQIVRTHSKQTSITQPPVAPCAGCLIQTTNKTKIQTQSSADKITTSLSLAHQRKNKQNKKLSTNLTLYEAYRNHWTKLRRTETKRKKEFSLEVWEKETSNTISLKKIMKRQRNTAQIKEQTRNTEVQTTQKKKTTGQ